MKHMRTYSIIVIDVGLNGLWRCLMLEDTIMSEGLCRWCWRYVYRINEMIYGCTKCRKMVCEACVVEQTCPCEDRVESLLF